MRLRLDVGDRVRLKGGDDGRGIGQATGRVTEVADNPRWGRIAYVVWDGLGRETMESTSDLRRAQ